ncbi:hypothetical protein M0746_000005 [Pseudomonas sp. P7]|nr:hypothetical protein [Pseudomonas sp. S11P7]MCR8972766.1 hypothetical protein [Pseudomonas sp. S11P7]
MNEQNDNLSSDNAVGKNQTPTAKSRNKLAFVSESEYEKKASAETLNMSVASFVKKKAQGSRLVGPN